MQGSINFDGSLVGNITGDGGGGGDTVVITPVVTSGTKIADVSVNGVEKDLYCPTPPTPPEVDITPVVTSGTKIADVSIDGVEKDLYAPNPTQVNITPVQQSGTKIATIGVNGVNTDLYAPESGGDIYSTSERVVGVWIDGRPLYQRTFTKQQVNIDDGLIKTESNLDIKYVYGTFHRTEDDAFLMLPFQAINIFCRVYAGYALYGGILLETNMIGSAIVTAIYTKTTDT